MPAMHQRQQNPGRGLALGWLKDDVLRGPVPQLLPDLSSMAGADDNENTLTRNQSFNSCQRMLQHRATANHLAKLFDASSVAEACQKWAHPRPFARCQDDSPQMSCRPVDCVHGKPYPKNHALTLMPNASCRRGPAAYHNGKKPLKRRRRSATRGCPSPGAIYAASGTAHVLINVQAGNSSLRGRQRASSVHQASRSVSWTTIACRT